jgi:hypothetical protein
MTNKLQVNTEVRAKLLVKIEQVGDCFHARYEVGTLGTIEETDVTGYDYEFYPFRQVGVCVRKEEIEILP